MVFVNRAVPAESVAVIRTSSLVVPFSKIWRGSSTVSLFFTIRVCLTFPRVRITPSESFTDRVSAPSIVEENRAVIRLESSESEVVREKGGTGLQEARGGAKAGFSCNTRPQPKTVIPAKSAKRSFDFTRPL